MSIGRMAPMRWGITYQAQGRSSKTAVLGKRPRESRRESGRYHRPDKHVKVCQAVRTRNQSALRFLYCATTVGYG